MSGAFIMVAILLFIPIAVCMTGVIGAAILGQALKIDGEKRHADSELLDLNV